ncbi:nitrile hydratase accessory protein [Ancylobacter radicis]|uniref:Nitrile hydratase accessory protein n=1 Tax=Ancylobacter radicis TaxID=2836179 RepID=A0ABS5R6J0_9HYPH|nr:nitrile hydratase accessory protein [Ancylobacter radicis]MBS9477279.1 nitrile hydratase accessory protein [Ancylobacter radicis]
MSTPAPEPLLPDFERPGAFAAPWEAMIFAIVLKLHEAGHFAWNDFAAALSAQIHAHPERSYYVCWTDAAITLLTERGLVEEAALLRQALAIERFRAADHHHIARTEPIAIGPAQG